MTSRFNDFPGYRPGYGYGLDWMEQAANAAAVHKARVREAVVRQARARNDMIENVLLHSLTGTCGVLVTDDPSSGDVTATVDERIPYATIVYAPRCSNVFGELDPALLEPARPESLEALLRHLAKKLVEAGGL